MSHSCRVPGTFYALVPSVLLRAGLVLCLAAPTAPVKAQVLEADSLALVALYNSTAGANWWTKTNWLTSSPLSTWPGVTVSGGRVTSLSLIYNNLTGAIPAEIGNLTSLEHLNLGGNLLTGAIPAEIGNLTSLIILYLGFNQLTGAIPAEIGNLTSLLFLQLFDNQLTDLPAVSPLGSLFELILHNNQFTFEDIEPFIEPYRGLPSSLFVYAPQDSVGSAIDTTVFVGSSLNLAVSVGGTPNVYQWMQDGGDISGATSNPYTVSNIQLADSGDYILRTTNAIVTDLTLYSRPIHVSVEYTPSQLDSLALVALYNSTGGASWATSTNWLTSNPLSTWHGVTVSGERVTALNLYENNLAGPLPAEIGSLTSLTQLRLYSNELTAIPAEIGNLTSLLYLILYNNQLTAIPAGIGGLTSLMELFLHHNQLTGPIPAEIGNLISLTDLNLGNNQLTAIPTELGNLTNLTTLNLYGNQLTVLPDLTALASLVYLRIENNQFTFEDIEPNIGLASNFTYSPQDSVGSAIDTSALVGSSLTLSVPVGGSANVYQWAQDGVDISGATSDAYTVSNIQLADSGDYILRTTNTLATALTLYSRPINVSVEYTPSQLDSLALVALYNSTAGANWWTKTNWLTSSPLSTWPGVTVTDGRVTSLSLGGNNLIGAIPAEIGNLTSLTALYLGFNQLTGIIPAEIGNLTSLIILYLDFNQLTGAIPTEIGSLTSLWGLLLNNNQLTDLPAVSALASLFELILHNNQFTFEDIEPYIEPYRGLPSSLFVYTPQDSVGSEIDTTVFVGSSLNLAVSVGGTANVYQWMQDGGDISGATSNPYTVSNIQLADSGDYILRTTNFIATDLTLYSRPIHVSVDYTPMHYDSLALVALYNSTGGASWTDNFNWLTSSPVSEWSRVNVSGGRVTYLDLYFNNLTGTIPAEIGNLTGLQYLDLSHNPLTALPAEIGTLTSLTVLILGFNQFTAIPAELSNLTSLTYLSLYYNLLTSLPDLTALTSLSNLHIENNQFTFEDIEPNIGVPSFTYSPQDSVGSAIDTSTLVGSSLTLSVPVGGTANVYQWMQNGVDISGATGDTYTVSNIQLADTGDYILRITNTLATDLTLVSSPINVLLDYTLQSDSLALVAFYNSTGGASWTTNTNWLTSNPLSTWHGVTVSGERVTELSLYRNNLSGSIPTEIGNLTSLTQLLLFDNQLTGAIPAEIGNLTSLETLSLYYNQLTGVIPTEIGSLTSLVTLNLGGNQLTAIPAEIGNLTSLITLSLFSNQLTIIPVEIGSLTSLVTLGLSDNQLTAIPAEIGNLTSLQGLYLSSNQLTAIPAWIGNLTSLRGLGLGRNQLTSLPAEIGNLTSLWDLWLNNNQLTAIPAWIGNLIGLTKLFLYDNQLTGLPAEIGNLTSLQEMYLSGNQLTAIPTEIGSLTSLYKLTLYSNQLTAIPAWIDNLTSLGSLYLNNNQLTDLPAEIGNLTSLRWLYLNDNQLTDLPDLTALASLNTLYINNNQFTFEDIEPYIGVPSSSFRYSPQDSVGSETDTAVFVGTILDLAVSVGGSANEYQWMKDGADVSGATSDVYINMNAQLADAGAYILRTTNTLATALTLYSRPIHVSVDYSPMQYDSLALVALYNSTDGANWTNNTNWLTPNPIDTWHGVTVSAGRVIYLDLSNNNLSGFLPAEIGNLTSLTLLVLYNNQLTAIPTEVGNLTSLTKLALYGNQLTDLPDLTALASLSELYLHNNQFTFEDIEPNIGLASSIFIYTPQDSVGSETDTTVFVGSSLNLAVLVGGTANLYQWVKDGVDVSGSTSDALAIPSVDFADAGAYILRTTNTLATALTLYSRPIHISVDYNPMHYDSLALVALYNSTDGVNWTDNTNWLTSNPVDTWHGVTVTDARVAELRLPSNNLSGTLPAEIGNLTSLARLHLWNNQLTAIPAEIGSLAGLTSLYLDINQLTGLPAEIGNLTSLELLSLSNNQLTDLPDLTALVSLSILQIQNNQLTFEDIEPNIGLVSNIFSYSPQDSVGSETDTTVFVGSSLNLAVLVGGTANVYQWVKDGVDVSGATDDTLAIPSVDLADTGAYILRTTNTLAADLTLYSRPIHVNIPNRVPIITSPTTATATEDIAFAYVITGSDVDGDPLTVGAYSLPGWLVQDADTLKGTPLNGDGNANFQIWVVDGSLDTAFQNLAITVIAVNDAPLAFNLIEPANNATIQINMQNLGNALIVTWEAAEDVDSDTIWYQLVVDSTLTDLVIGDTSFIADTVSYDYSDIVTVTKAHGRVRLSGNWTILATDGIDTTWATNGPFHLAINLDPSVLYILANEGLPTEFALHQNYPNPFNPSTTLDFDLPRATDIRVAVVDLLGREVVRLVDQRLPAGYHQLVWNGRDRAGQQVPTGMYIVLMQTPEYRKSIKLLLLK